MSFAPTPAAPASLVGDARARGLAQAGLPDTDAEAVRRAVFGRLEMTPPSAKGRDFIAGQAALLERLDPDGAAELAGIAEGFGISAAELLAYLHLGVLAEMEDEGCSTFAVPGLLGKNRDYRGEHAALQRVFHHRDPDGAEIICIGSLGSPGAFSSGMNAHGLALVDTHVGTRDHGPGLLRYFLMTRLLWRCRTVAEALVEVARLPHAGGGSMTLADAGGAHASVELGHRATGVESDARPFRVRTNHFVLEETREAFVPVARDPLASDTMGRHGRLVAWLEGGNPGLAEAASMLAGHAVPGFPALCKHGEDGGSGTISGTLFAPAERALYFCPENPCSGRWFSYSLGRPAEVQGEL